MYDISKRLSFNSNFWQAISGGLGAIGNVVGGLIGSKAQKQANQTNLQIAREANQANRENLEYQNQWNLEQWNRENEYNSPLEQRNRLAAAGINPLNVDMANSQASNLTSGTPQPQVVPQIQNEGSALAQGIMNGSDIISEIAQKSAEINKLEADTEAQTIQNYINEASKDKQVEMYGVQVDLYGALKGESEAKKINITKSTDLIAKNIDYISKQIDKLDKDINMQDWYKDYQERVFKFTKDKQHQDLLLGYGQLFVKLYESNLTYDVQKESNAILKERNDHLNKLTDAETDIKNLEYLDLANKVELGIYDVVLSRETLQERFMTSLLYNAALRNHYGFISNYYRIAEGDASLLKELFKGTGTPTPVAPNIRQ